MPAAAANAALKLDVAEDVDALLEDYKGQVDAIRRSQAVIEFNLDGTVIDANDHFLGVLGYTLAEIRDQHHRMFVDPAEQNTPAYRAFWQKLGRGEYDAGQYKRIGKGGREVWIEASYNPVFNAAGKPVKVIKFATDITAQKQGVIRAQAMENLFASVMMVDRDLNITYVNAGTKALLAKHAVAFRNVWPNFDPNKIIGLCIDQFHKDPSHQRRILADPANLPHTAEIGVGPLRVALSITAIFDPGGAYVGNCLEWDDVTERRHQEAVNADYTSQLQAISKSQAVIEFNLDGTIREANANFLSALGYTMEEIRGQHHRLFVDPAEQGTPAYREFWERFARGEANIGQFKRIAKGGRVI